MHGAHQLEVEHLATKARHLLVAFAQGLLRGHVCTRGVATEHTRIGAFAHNQAHGERCLRP